MMSKVCMITSVHPTFDTRIFYKEAKSLVKAGYDVTLLAQHDKPEIVDGIKIDPLPKPKNRFERMTRTVWTAYRKALKIDADVYHFHDPELIPVGLLLKKKGFKVIYDIHEDTPRALLSSGNYYLPTYGKRMVSLLLEELEHLATPYFNANIAATRHIADRFRKNQMNTYVINNFPILEELGGRESRLWSERQNAIAYVGVISLERGLREMVQAMGYLPDNLGARLKLAGNFSPPDSRVGMMNLNGWRSVNEQGFLRRRDIGQLFSQVKVGLVLIHPEPRYMCSQPTKLFEFMSAGIPVIASDFPLWRDIIKRDGCGLMVNPLDPHAIATAIEYLLTHDAEAEEMGQRGRRAIEEKYNWSVEEDKLMSIYRSVLSVLSDS